MEEPEGRLRFLDYAEEASLLKVAPPIVQDVIVIGTNCGIRIASEALTLTWNNVDFLRNQLTVSAAFAKAVETRSVPRNSRARAVLLSPGHCTEAIERIAEEFHNWNHNTPISGQVVHLAERAVSV